MRSSQTRARRATQNASCCRVLSSSPMFNRWLDRSTADLQIMLTDTPHGSYPYAGIPWFSTPFGRDGSDYRHSSCYGSIRPSRAACWRFWPRCRRPRGTTSRMPSPARSSTRCGEARWRRWAKCRSAATTAAVMRRHCSSCSRTRTTSAPAIASSSTGSGRTSWRPSSGCDTSGDPDQDGFIDYSRRTDAGLINQGWKDSHDSIFHDDGTSAEGPIALCEVQGYARAPPLQRRPVFRGGLAARPGRVLLERAIERWRRQTR